MPPLPQYPATQVQLSELAESLQRQYQALSAGASTNTNPHNSTANWHELAVLVDNLCADPYLYLRAQLVGEGEKRKMPPAATLVSSHAVERYWADFFYHTSDPHGYVHGQLGYLKARDELLGMTPGEALSDPYVEFLAWFRVLWCPLDSPQYGAILLRWRRSAVRGIRANPLLYRYLAERHEDKLSRLTQPA